MSKTKDETEYLNIIHDGENSYYTDGLNRVPFRALPQLTLSTTPEELSQMIDDYNIKYCEEHNCRPTDDNEFSKSLECMHLNLQMFAEAYLDGLKESENKT